MKFRLFLLCLLVSLLFLSCGVNVTDILPEDAFPAESGETLSEPVNMLVLIRDGVTEYTVYRSDKADPAEQKAASTFFRQLKEKTGCDIAFTTDYVKPSTDMHDFDGAKEILIGRTNRLESEQVLAELEGDAYAIRVIGDKLVILGTTPNGTAQAVDAFLSGYLSDGASELTLPRDLSTLGTVDYGYCAETGMTYLDMANEVYDAFLKNCFTKGQFRYRTSQADFWDNAEMFEMLCDVCEAEPTDSHLNDLKTAADYIIRTRGTDWSSNVYNDDIMWMCIAFTRAYLLTGEADYVTYARKNFTIVYKRGWTDDLGGGLWWKQDERKGKNSCVNCPAAIAACYLAKALGDDSYYETARTIMDWEIDTLFSVSDGAVHDNISTGNAISTYHSTYNQGTFIGACTLLHEHYGDDAYLTYAEKAADYAMKKLTTKQIFDNGESTGGDLIGFKGILTRWLYRYAVYRDDCEILEFLQFNARTAYQNRNADGMIWTVWQEKTPANVRDYDVYGFSTAVALLFNSLPW